jgi:hypothetical protein
VGHQFNRRVCLSFFRINLRLLLAISPSRDGIKVERRGRRVIDAAVEIHHAGRRLLKVERRSSAAFRGAIHFG